MLKIRIAITDIEQAIHHFDEIQPHALKGVSPLAIPMGIRYDVKSMTSIHLPLRGDLCANEGAPVTITAEVVSVNANCVYIVDGGLG